MQLENTTEDIEVTDEQIEKEIRADKSSQYLPRLVKIQTLIWRINENIYKPKNKLLMLSILKELELLVESAIDWNQNAIDYLNKRPVPKYKEVYFDEQGNVFSVIWVTEATLNYRYWQLKATYKWSPKMCYFLQALNGFLKSNCWLRDSKVKLIGKYDYDLLQKITNTPNQSDLTKEEQKIYNLIYNKR